MKKLIISLLMTAVLCMGTAQAAAPEITDTATGDGQHTMTVTVDDISAVADQVVEMDEEIDILAQLVYAEARGVNSKAERAAVIWCALNRADAGFSDGTIAGVVKSRSQFAYSSGLPITEENKSLAKDVLIRWLLEKRGVADVGRTLPSDFLYFAGRDGHNWFRRSYGSRSYWDWSLPDPYTEANKEE